MEQLNLEQIREEINGINDEMLKLFIRRMELSGRVARYKKGKGLPTLDRRREEEILQRVADLCPPQYRPYALDFFKALMATSREYQDGIR